MRRIRMFGNIYRCGLIAFLFSGLGSHKGLAVKPREEPPVLVGRFVGVDEAQREVTIDISRESLVIVDATDVFIARLGSWLKRQRDQEEILATISVPLARVNRLHGVRNDRLVGRIDVAMGKRMTLCMATKKVLLGAKKSPNPNDAGVLLGLRGMEGVKCYELEPAGGVTRTPPSEDHECMRECRQRNMMRAVSAEVIDEDCQKICSPK